MNEKAIELLEDAKKEHNDDCILCAVKDTRINSVLALLKQPKCKTCGDTKVVAKYHGDTKDNVKKVTKIEGLPCPDCQQPLARNYPTRTIENTEVCPCGNVFFDDDDYDTLGSESGVCCPSCGNEKFQTVKERLDQAEASKVELLTVCKNSPNANMFSLFADFAEECFTKPSMAVYRNKFNGLATFLRSCQDRAEKMEAAIAKYQSRQSVEPEVR